LKKVADQAQAQPGLGDVNNSNPGERVKIRIKQVSRHHAVADVI